MRCDNRDNSDNVSTVTCHWVLGELSVHKCARYQHTNAQSERVRIVRIRKYIAHVVSTHSHAVWLFGNDHGDADDSSSARITPVIAPDCNLQYCESDSVQQTMQHTILDR